MKNTTIRLFAAALMVGLGWSCEKVIPIDAEVKAPKLVANSWVSPDTTYTVHLSQSLSVLAEGDLENIENGTVRVLDAGGSLIETLTHAGEGYYTGNERPVVGSTYRIEASAPGFNSISASSSVPGPSTIVSASGRSQSVGFEESLEVTVTIQDAPGDNYYLLRLRRRRDSTRPDFNYYFITTNDPAFELSGDDDGSASWGPFRDVLFDGENYTFKITVPFFFFDPEDDNLPFEIELYSTNEAGYNYRRSFELYKQTEGNPFAQPVQVFSNVEGGFGCVSGYSLTTLSFEL
ncbi:MAG: DUF4249 domain-containing protein [Salibacteraceae bacterium]